MSVIRNLVFEGGGVKGAAYVGVVEALSEDRILDKVERVAGTSAGAISATLLALGYNSGNVRKILESTQMADFMDDTIGIIRDLWNTFRHFGWHRGDTFVQWIKKYIKQATGKEGTTFGELHALREKDKRYKDLYVIVTNLSRQRAEVMSHEATSNVPIWWAVRASMSIPLFFEVVKNPEGELYVDGGVSWNYAIDLFDNHRYMKKRVGAGSNGNGGVLNTETLGLRLDEPGKNAPNGGQQPPMKIKNIRSYGTALVGFMLDVANNAHLRKEDRARTIIVDSLGVGATEFRLSKERTADLIVSGYRCTRSFLEWRRKKLQRGR